MTSELVIADTVSKRYPRIIFVHHSMFAVSSAIKNIC